MTIVMLDIRELPEGAWKIEGPQLDLNGVITTPIGDDIYAATANQVFGRLKERLNKMFASTPPVSIYSGDQLTE